MLNTIILRKLQIIPGFESAIEALYTLIIRKKILKTLLLKSLGLIEHMDIANKPIDNATQKITIIRKILIYLIHLYEYSRSLKLRRKAYPDLLTYILNPKQEMYSIDYICTN